MGFCKACQACLDGTVMRTGEDRDEEHYPEYHHHEFGRGFGRAVQSGCQICNRIWKQMKRGSPNLDPATDPLFQSSQESTKDDDNTFTVFAYRSGLYDDYYIQISSPGDFWYDKIEFHLLRSPRHGGSSSESLRGVISALTGKREEKD